MTKAGDESDARARDYLDNARRCEACGRQVATRGRTIHFSCDPDSLAGAVCTCPIGCSDTHWGNGAAACDPQCKPCRLMAGRKLPTKKEP